MLFHGLTGDSRPGELRSKPRSSRQHFQEEQATDCGGTYSIFTVTAKPRNNVPPARLELIRQAAKANSIALELAAAFLASGGEQDACRETATNFMPNNNIGSAFGQTTSAYRDSSGTVDPGGRILEWVFRLNF